MEAKEPHATSEAEAEPQGENKLEEQEKLPSDLQEAKKAQENRKKKRLKRFSVKKFISRGRDFLQKIKGELVGGQPIDEDEKFQAAHEFLTHYLEHWAELEAACTASISTGKTIDDTIKAARKSLSNGMKILEDLEAAFRQYLPKLLQMSAQIQNLIRDAELKVQVIQSRIKGIAEERAANYRKRLEHERAVALEKYKEERRTYIRGVEVLVRQEAEKKKALQTKDEEEVEEPRAEPVAADKRKPGKEEKKEEMEDNTQEVGAQADEHNN